MVQNFLVTEQKHVYMCVCVLQHLDRPGISFCFRSDDPRMINAIEIYKCPTLTRSLFILSFIFFKLLQK